MKKQEHLKEEEEALCEALTPIVNKLIDKNYETSKDKIASQMAPLMGDAIREQIKNQKDDVVDALYPVMGNMISRYVSKSLEEMLESINQKIQSGLSVDALKRKIEAKIKGVSETELLLQESSSTYIKAILLIHKETGVVLTQAHASDSAINEPEMVASMMTAIRSFINDWVEKNEKDSEVGEIDYGGSKIVIENGGYSYLAVIVDGAIYNKTYNRIRETFEDVILKYTQEIRDFYGDLGLFPSDEIKNKLLPLLGKQQEQKQEQKEKQKIHPLIFLIPLLLVGFLSWKWYQNYIDEKLINNINTALYKTPQLTIYRIKAMLKDDEIVLKGEVPSKYHKTLAQDIVKKIKTDKKTNNELMVIKTKDTPDMINEKVSYILSALNTNKCLNATYKYDLDKITISGTSCDLEHKKTAIELIKNATKVDTIEDNIKVKIKEKKEIIHPDIKEIIYFKKGSYSIDKEQELKLQKLMQTLKNLDKNATVIVTGHSDNSGTLRAKKRVAEKRAKTIAKLLKDRFYIKQKIQINSNAKPPKGVDADKSPDKARCSIITVEF
jgi:outer membrane protein OmpA-like peptidoglycan-associated protein